MIISASRRTDIPAFYSEWFMNRIKEGYLISRNGSYMSNNLYKVLLTPDIVDCIAFWTKNPIPMLPRLDELKDYMYYFQFTLTGYGRDIEHNIPDKPTVIIPAFQELSSKIGPDRVIWRYDPILISDKYSVEYHFEAFSQIAERLNGYTKKCVFSFIDKYYWINESMRKLGVKEISDEVMRDISIKIRDIAKDNGMVVATCAEGIDLDELGIGHNACIDKELIEKLTGGKIKELKKYLEHTGQREACRCVISKETGTRNTCKNGCVYCYANDSEKKLMDNISKYDPNSPILCDVIGPDEVVKDASDMKSIVIKDSQMSIFDFKE
ncbi:protein of unknown function [Lachnospiraceae bacterium NE2001]|nr:protein of unknown function [Lachnospiraceae bacterium NE2001]